MRSAQRRRRTTCRSVGLLLVGLAGLVFGTAAADEGETWRTIHDRQRRAFEARIDKLAARFAQVAIAPTYGTVYRKHLAVFADFQDDWQHEARFGVALYPPPRGDAGLPPGESAKARGEVVKKWRRPVRIGPTDNPRVDARIGQLVAGLTAVLDVGLATSDETANITLYLSAGCYGFIQPEGCPFSRGDDIVLPLPFPRDPVWFIYAARSFDRAQDGKRSFHRDATVFAPDQPWQVDGFIVSNRGGEIEQGVCILHSGQSGAPQVPEDMRIFDTLLRECLLRSLGLVEVAEGLEGSLLAPRRPRLSVEMLNELGREYFNVTHATVPDPAEPAAIAPLERLMLRLLYDPRMKPGMTREEAETAASEILSDLIIPASRLTGLAADPLIPF